MIFAYETAVGKQNYTDSVMDCECNISLKVCSLKMSHTIPAVAKATVSTMWGMEPFRLNRLLFRITGIFSMLVHITSWLSKARCTKLSGKTWLGLVCITHTQTISLKLAICNLRQQILCENGTYSCCYMTV